MRLKLLRKEEQVKENIAWYNETDLFMFSFHLSGTGTSFTIYSGSSLVQFVIVFVHRYLLLFLFTINLLLLWLYIIIYYYYLEFYIVLHPGLLTISFVGHGLTKQKEKRKKIALPTV